MLAAEVFKALGDPKRLEIVEKLSTGKSYTLTTLSQGLKITRQGARKHLKILEDSHLIRLISKGRDTQVVLDQKALELSKKYILKLEKQWNNRLERLKVFVENKN